MKSSLQIRTKRMTVDMQMNNHNLLRWAAMAIDTNPVLANSLIAYSANASVLFVDMLYLVTHSEAFIELPPNTHIALWDGVNSYIELIEARPNIAPRKDLKFFVVGWLAGHMLEHMISIKPLYPSLAPSDAVKWCSLLCFERQFNVPYRYRTTSTILSFSRYFKNWLADATRHNELNKGGKIVFCGMVTPTEHQIHLFFRGVDSPDLLNTCMQITKLNYADNALIVDEVAQKVILALKDTALISNADYACAYSVLNILHRIKTISLLNTQSDSLFVNETRSNRWLDPYDSFFYRNNLYLDFGSTRAPDAIYPRTLDIVMKSKPYISLRFLSEYQTFDQYIQQFSFESFIKNCNNDAHLAQQKHAQMVN